MSVNKPRELCPICHANLVAINYKCDSEYHYRKSCASCIRKGRRLKPVPPAWAKAGYTKTDKCEKCGFKARYTEQLSVFHSDGNLKNTNWLNLKTVCLNCALEINKSKLPWKASPLVPDF